MSGIKGYIKIKETAEVLLWLSPLLVIFGAMFNFTDTKWILSRLIPVVILYSLVFYRKEIKYSWQKCNFKPFIWMSFGLSFYFILMHLIRGDEFGFPRTLLTAIIYLLCVPWHRVSGVSIKVSLVCCGLLCGLNAGYEYFYMHIARVGIATNPIPYALFCAVLSLMNYGILFDKGNNKILRFMAALAAFSCTIALLLTDVRGVLIFFPFVVLYLAFRMLAQKTHHYILIFSILFLSCAASYITFQTKIDARIAATASEIDLLVKDQYTSSIGIRLMLWKNGLAAGNQAPILGLGRDELTKMIETSSDLQVREYPHIHNQYIDMYARYGLIGLIGLAIWMVLGAVEIKRHNSRLSITFCINNSAVLLIILLAGCTDVPFHHTHLVYLYPISVGILFILQQKNKNLSLTTTTNNK